LHLSKHERTSTDAPLAGFLCPPVGAGFGSCRTGPGLDEVEAVRSLVRRPIDRPSDPPSVPPEGGPGSSGALAPTAPGLAARSGQSRRFFAAVSSRSTFAPHASQVRIFASFGPTSIPPQPWWSIDEGNHRSATTRRRPERSAVYLRVGLRVQSPASEAGSPWLSWRLRPLDSFLASGVVLCRVGPLELVGSALRDSRESGSRSTT